ncbi:MAG TPA: M48 family metallopeptidase [Planctomycetota bacterium]|nr:M48 family metallopeptidase [Planctomycetota bacterium]
MRSRLLLSLALPLLLLSCKTNKVTGRSQAHLFSESQMNQMGVQAYAEMTGPAQAKLLTDPRYLAPLQEVGAAISAAANKPDYKWEFRLIDDPKTVNAWCLPGGKIAFYTAIYPVLDDTNGMAIVMGHEVMHAILEHGNERMSQSAISNMVLEVGSVALSNNKYHDEIIGLMGAGATVGVLLPFSRKQESEADKWGLYLAAQAGYDPEAAIQVWERMLKLAGGNAPPKWLSTHPPTQERIDNMKAWMPKAKEYYAKSQKKANRKLAIPPGVGAK